MPQHRAPGIHAGEVVTGQAAIALLACDTALFLGALDGVSESVASPLLLGWDDFVGCYGHGATALMDELGQPRHLPWAVWAFFRNGGRRLHVVPVTGAAGTADYARALAASESLDEVGLLAVPGATALANVHTDALLRLLVQDVERRDGHRFLVLDAPLLSSPAQLVQWRQGLVCTHAALYHPWVKVAHPTPTAAALSLVLPPSGFLCGLLARLEIEHGLHHAPVNVAPLGVVGLADKVDFLQQDLLVRNGFNLLREVDGHGLRIWGGRTLSDNPERRYIATCRLVDQIRRSLLLGTRWAALQPQGAGLHARLDAQVADLLHFLWRDGVLAGERAEQAYFVRWDSTSMSAADPDQGRLLCLVGVATFKPSEFQVFKLVHECAAQVS